MAAVSPPTPLMTRCRSGHALTPRFATAYIRAGQAAQVQDVAMVDLENCPCSGKTLTRLVHPAILGALAKGEAHGYEIIQRLAELSSFAAPDAAGIYRALNVMERDGYVAARWDAPQAGPARKVFHLTASGRTCLGQWRRTLHAYRNDLDRLLTII
jgi:DNA-binding PadR family transcriptional regulator